MIIIIHFFDKQVSRVLYFLELISFYINFNCFIYLHNVSGQILIKNLLPLWMDCTEKIILFISWCDCLSVLSEYAFNIYCYILCCLTFCINHLIFRMYLLLVQCHWYSQCILVFNTELYFGKKRTSFVGLLESCKY